MSAAMLGMANAGFVVGAYVVAFGGIGLYTWRMLARARRVGRDVPVEDRPWT